MEVTTFVLVVFPPLIHQLLDRGSAQVKMKEVPFGNTYSSVQVIYIESPREKPDDGRESLIEFVRF